MSKQLGVSKEGFTTAWEANRGNDRATARALAINPQTALNWAGEYGLDAADPGRPGIPDSSEAFIVYLYEERDLTATDISDVLSSGPSDDDFPRMTEGGVRKVLHRNGVETRRKGPNNT